MILGEIRYSIAYTLGVVFAAGIMFSSCAKNGVETPTPLSTYNLSAYSDNEFLTFNATGTDYGDSVFDINGTWVTNIGETYELKMLHIKLNSVGYYLGTFYLTNVQVGAYDAYKTGSSSTNYLFDYYTTPTYNGALLVNKISGTGSNKYISGTFSFSGYSYVTNNAVNINKGQFTNVKITP